MYKTVNNDIVRSYRIVMVITNSVTKRTIKNTYYSHVIQTNKNTQN